MPIHFENEIKLGKAGVFLTKSSCERISILTAPVITGSVEVGQTLTCSLGTYSGTAPYIVNAYIWTSPTGGVLQSGLSNTYLIPISDVGKEIQCSVQIYNCAGLGLAANNASALTIPVPAPTTYLFDIYAANSVTPFAAFSLRKLSSSYAGSCIRIRRASDNAELDIGFVSNVVDTAAIIAFSSGFVAHIVVVYDQTGNNRNRQTTIAIRQPHIMNASNVIFTTNSKPAIRFNNTNHTLQQSTPVWLSDAVPYASHMVYRESAAQDNILFFSSSGVYAFVAVFNSNASSYSNISSSLNKVNNVTQTINTRGEAYTQLSAKTTAIAHYTNFILGSTAGVLNIGGYGLVGGFVWDGFYLEEVIFQNSTNVSNATLTAAVFANQQIFYAL